MPDRCPRVVSGQDGEQDPRRLPLVRPPVQPHLQRLRPLPRIPALQLHRRLRDLRHLACHRRLRQAADRAAVDAAASP